MIHVKDHKQRDMFNPFAHLGIKRLEAIESSWAHLFREEILHNLPVEKLFPFYNEFKGRKSKELYAMLGLVLIQQMEDCTDEQAVQQFAFNLIWQYALNITDASDAASYVSLRTLWKLRDIVAQNGLQDALFENVTKTLQKLFTLDPSKQRLDSVHIFSNMAHLGRIRIFVRTIRTFLTNLKRQHAKEYDAIGELVLRYDKKSDGSFAIKPTESTKKLVELGDDCFLLIERFKGNTAVLDMKSYQQLVRMFTEQCIVEKDDNGERAVIKASKDVPSSSLQNPSDPDAGYSGHKGKGYQMQVMETYSEDKSQPNLITHAKVESANESDSNALLPAIVAAEKLDLAPTELLADTLYGSDENVGKAKELGITVIAPVMGAKENATGLADFIFSDTDQIIACPEQQLPIRTKINKQGCTTTVYFDKVICDMCRRQSECQVKRDKKSCTISYDAKSLRLSLRRKCEKEPAFAEKYRYRSGVEGTMSDLDRITGLKHLRVRGMPQVRMAAVLKATGLNILRSMTFKNRFKRLKTGKRLLTPSFFGLIVVIKEQILQLWSYFREISRRCRDNYRIIDFKTQTA